MAQIVVRGLEEDVKLRLRARAARHGHSMEAEVRDILRDAAKDEAGQPVEGLGMRISALFKGIGLKPGEALERVPFEEPRNPFDK